MIDNEAKTIELLMVMKENLPIPVVTTKELLHRVRQNDIDIPKDHNFEIKNILYFGDEGGICCDLSLPEGAEKVFVTSLTHLRIDPRHAVAKEIKSYQKRRIKKLARQRR
jgi:hypothetical protein